MMYQMRRQFSRQKKARTLFKHFHGSTQLLRLPRDAPPKESRGCILSCIPNTTNHHHQPTTPTLAFRKNELHWTIPHPPKTQPKTPKPRRPTPTTGPTPIPHASIVWQRQHHCQRSPNRNTTVSHASTNHVLQ